MGIANSASIKVTLNATKSDLSAILRYTDSDNRTLKLSNVKVWLMLPVNESTDQKLDINITNNEPK